MATNAHLLRIISIQVAIHGAMTGMRMACPLLALHLGYSTAAVGFLIALFALTQVFISVPAGRYADSHSLTRPVTMSIMVAVFAALLSVCWPLFPVLCVTALCMGGAAGSSLIALQRYASRMTEDPVRLRQIFSWITIGPAFSNFIGPFLCGFVIDHLGFQAAFFAMAVLPVLAWFWLRKIPGGKEAPPRPEAVKHAFWDLLGLVQVRRLLFVNWLIAACWDTHAFMLPVLGHERGFSASVIGSILGAFAIAAALLRVVLPLFTARIQEWKVVMGAMVSTGLIFAAYPFVTSPIPMGVCSILLGFSLGVVQPMMLSMLHHATPSDRHGEVIGLRATAINVSSVITPLVFGSVGAALGAAGAFWLLSAMVTTGAGLAAKLRHGARGE